MKLETLELRRLLPPLYSQEHTPDPLCWAKFFTPDGQWTWYAIEFDGKDLCFGYVIGFEAELGYFRPSELMAVRGPFGLPVERDVYFEPCRLSEVKAKVKKAAEWAEAEQD